MHLLQILERVEMVELNRESNDRRWTPESARDNTKSFGYDRFREQGADVKDRFDREQPVRRVERFVLRAVRRSLRRRCGIVALARIASYASSVAAGWA